MSARDAGPDAGPTTSPTVRPPRPFPTDEELRAAGWVKVSRRVKQFASTPRVGQYFWVDFPHDAYAPEFVDEHPGIVIRAARRAHDTCIVVPVTSRPQAQDNAAHCWRFVQNPNPKGEREGVVAWAVCDHLYTVHVNRLRPVLDRRGTPTYPRATAADLQGIFAAIRGVLPHVFNVEDVAPPQPVAPTPSSACSPTPATSNTLSLAKKP